MRSETSPEELLEEFVGAVWASRSDIRVIRSEAEWPPSLWLLLAEQVPASTPAIAVEDGELIVGYRFVPLRIDSSEWWVVEATSYGRFASNHLLYDQGWKLDDYAAADRTPLSAGERERFRNLGSNFADE